MLNKTVCKACVNSRADKPIEGFGPVWQEWKTGDDVAWSNGYVVCRMLPIVDAKIDREPPNWCEYAAEHAVCRKKKS